MAIANRRFTLSDGIEERCAPDTMSPAQFYEMWSGTADRSTEFKLAFAVLEQALDDFEKHCHAHDNRGQRLYRQTQTWVQSNDRQWPYSFVNICDILDIPCDRLRRHILRQASSNSTWAAKLDGTRARLGVRRVCAGALGSCSEAARR